MEFKTSLLTYVTLKAGVRPKDVIDKVLASQKYQNLVWATQIEDPNVLAIVIRSTESQIKQPDDGLFDGTDAESFHMEFDVGDLTRYPATEVVFPCFSSDIAIEHARGITDPLLAFNLQKEEPEGTEASLGLAAGWITGFPHPSSPTGVNANAMFIGWTAPEAHVKRASTANFKKVAGPLFEMMLPFQGNLGIKHFHFQEAV